MRANQGEGRPPVVPAQAGTSHPCPGVDGGAVRSLLPRGEKARTRVRFTPGGVNPKPTTTAPYAIAPLIATLSLPVMPAKAGIQVRDSAHPRRRRGTRDSARGSGAADVAQRRIYPGDRPSEPGPHGQNRRPPKSDLSISNRPNKLSGTHPLNWFPPSPSLDRLARLPNSGGISPLNWFSLRRSHLQVGEVAQLRRYLSAQLVRAEAQHSQIGEVAQLRRYLSAQPVRAEAQRFQVGEVAQLRRYLTDQLVVVEEQHFQVGEVDQLRRYLSAQLVLAEAAATPG